MRQRAPEPDTFLMGSNCVVAIATSSLRVRSCNLLWSCRDAARRRCHEFRPDWIGDRFAQDPVDLSLDGRIKSTARHLVDRLPLVGLTRPTTPWLYLDRASSEPPSEGRACRSVAERTDRAVPLRPDIAR